MRTILAMAVFCLCFTAAHAQRVYKIKTDSLKVTNDSCTAELILENSTKHINGYLYNRGNGRTEFRSPITKINDSVFYFTLGDDTVKIGPGVSRLLTGNGLVRVGDSVKLGGTLTELTKINMNKKSIQFNITDDTLPYKGGDVRIRANRDTITDYNNLYVMHFQKGGRMTGDAGVGSIYAETWYQTSEVFNTGVFANYVSRHKSSNPYNVDLRNARLFGFRSMFELKENHKYGELTHFQAQYVYSGDAEVDRIYGLQIAALKKPNTSKAYAIYTAGNEDSVLVMGPVRFGKYRNTAAKDSVLTVDSVGNISLKASGQLGVNATVQSLKDSSTVVWNINNGINGSVKLRGANRELSIQNPITGYTYQLKVEQDSTGGRNISQWPAGTRWVNGVAPVFTSLPNSIDLVSLYYDGANYYGWIRNKFLEGPAAVAIHTYDARVGTGANTHSLTNVPPGALLVLTTSHGTHLENATITSSPSLTWTRRAEASEDESGDAEIYTAVFTTGGNISVTSTWVGFSYLQSSTCYVILNQEGSLGGATAIGEGQAAPNVSITTTRAKSLLIGVSSDWNAINGSSRTYRNSATETNYSYGLGDMTGYHYYYLAPTISSYTTGLSAPTGQSAGTCIIEIRGNEP
ncbi:MAG: hypothetical protein QM781_13005 [Chitinophagaceae bacterium]